MGKREIFLARGMTKWGNRVHFVAVPRDRKEDVAGRRALCGASIATGGRIASAPVDCKRCRRRYVDLAFSESRNGVEAAADCPRCGAQLGANAEHGCDLCVIWRDVYRSLRSVMSEIVLRHGRRLTEACRDDIAAAALHQLQVIDKRISGV